MYYNLTSSLAGSVFGFADKPRADNPASGFDGSKIEKSLKSVTFVSTNKGQCWAGFMPTFMPTVHYNLEGNKCMAFANFAELNTVTWTRTFGVALWHQASKAE